MIDLYGTGVRLYKTFCGTIERSWHKFLMPFFSCHITEWQNALNIIQEKPYYSGYFCSHKIAHTHKTIPENEMELSEPIWVLGYYIAFEL